MTLKEKFDERVAQNPVVPGSEAYIVASTFFHQLEKSEETEKPPSQINNKSLIKNGKFKPNLKWKMLKSTGLVESVLS